MLPRIENIDASLQSDIDSLISKFIPYLIMTAENATDEKNTIFFTLLSKLNDPLINEYFDRNKAQKESFYQATVNSAIKLMTYSKTKNISTDTIVQTLLKNDAIKQYIKSHRDLDIAIQPFTILNKDNTLAQSTEPTEKKQASSLNADVRESIINKLCNDWNNVNQHAFQEKVTLLKKTLNEKQDIYLKAGIEKKVWMICDNLLQTNFSETNKAIQTFRDNKNGINDTDADKLTQLIKSQQMQIRRIEQLAILTKKLDQIIENQTILERDQKKFILSVNTLLSIKYSANIERRIKNLIILSDTLLASHTASQKSIPRSQSAIPQSHSPVFPVVRKSLTVPTTSVEKSSTDSKLTNYTVTNNHASLFSSANTSASPSTTALPIKNDGVSTSDTVLDIELKKVARLFDQYLCKENGAQVALVNFESAFSKPTDASFTKLKKNITEMNELYEKIKQEFLPIKQKADEYLKSKRVTLNHKKNRVIINDESKKLAGIITHYEDYYRHLYEFSRMEEQCQYYPERFNKILMDNIDMNITPIDTTQTNTLRLMT